MKFGLAVLGLFAVFHGCNACTCLPMNITDKFCSADFVARVTILANLTSAIEGDTYGPHMYEVDISEVYRTNENITGEWVMDQNRIYTGPHSAACGVTGLYEGNTYILSGPLTPDNTQLSINICSSIIEEAVVPTGNGYGGGYKGNNGGNGKGKSYNNGECGEGKVLYGNICISEELATLLTDPSPLNDRCDCIAKTIFEQDIRRSKRSGW